MYNNIYLGGSPDTAGLSVESLDSQIRQLNAYRARLQELQQSSMQAPEAQKKSLWTSLDQELETMTSEQMARLNSNSEYQTSYSNIQTLVQQELMNLVKNKIETSENGKKLLESHLALTKELKTQIMTDARKEMELFLKFKDYAKNNPNSTYEDFLKNNV
jgi:hypothetical protein